MIEHILFITIDRNTNPVTGLFCNRFGRYILPGTHIISSVKKNQKCVGCIISYRDYFNIEINVYKHYNKWLGERSISKLTELWSHGLKKLVTCNL